jgi:hypothetical protein
MKKYLLVILLAIAQFSNAQSVYFSKDIITSGNKATVIGVNGTLLSGLGNGLAKLTAGVPSIAINSDLPVMTATVGGAVPTPPNDATKYLNGQGAFVNALIPSTVVASSTMQSTGLGIGISPSALLHISKTVNQSAWTINGAGLRIDTATYTDNSSSGTVAAVYNHYIGSIKNAASSSTTYTIPYNVFIKAPTQGTNVAFTNTAAALGLGGNLYFAIGATATIGVVDANSLVIKTNLSTRTTWTSAGLQTHTHTAASSGTTPFMTFTQAVNTGGSAGGLLWTAGAHTGQTSGTEINDWNINLNRTITWLTTVPTTQRFITIGQPTISCASSSTTTTASILSFDGPPLASGSAAITNPYVLNIKSGNSYHDGKFVQGQTIITPGTTGNQTINKPTGIVNIAAAGTSITVTNNLVTTSSIIIPVIMSNDATALIKNVVVSSGSFVITLNAAATAETKVAFQVLD